MDPSPQKDHASIMVLEEDSAAAAPTRPDELITLQLGGRSRWFVRHMPRSGSVACDSTLICRQPNILPACTLENVEEEAQAATAQAATAHAAVAQVAIAHAAIAHAVVAQAAVQTTTQTAAESAAPAVAIGNGV